MRKLEVGEPAPWFIAENSNNNSRFHFDTCAGYYNVLCFYGSIDSVVGKNIHNHILSHRELFDDKKLAFYGVSIDKNDKEKEKVKHQLPGIRYFWDFDSNISRKYHVFEKSIQGKESIDLFIPCTFILDPMLRIIKVIEAKNPESHNKEFSETIKNLPEINNFASTEISAPALILPRVFEPDFCRHLIDLYNQNGGTDSGFMEQKGEKTVATIDYRSKRRTDYMIKDASLRSEIKKKLVYRVIPEIKKAFQFKVERIERYIVACYDGDVGGFFFPHRDDTTTATSHRKFAVTINLNTEEYEGGDLRFPEFGTKTYRAPTGGAVVFSCSLLHTALPVTKGKRYAFLPFLYDDEGEKIRVENEKFLVDARALNET